jgi:DnaJ-class molecular chaperone
VAAKNYYAVLGVGRDADDTALKTAYRKLARMYHPDRNPGDKTAEERFKEINEAYAVLSDAEKRAHYDRFGTVPGGGGVRRAGRFEDLFEASSARPSVAVGPARGETSAGLEISWEAARAGGKLRSQLGRADVPPGPAAGTPARLRGLRGPGRSSSPGLLAMAALPRCAARPDQRPGTAAQGSRAANF